MSTSLTVDVRDVVSWAIGSLADCLCFCLALCGLSHEHCETFYLFFDSFRSATSHFSLLLKIDDIVATLCFCFFYLVCGMASQIILAWTFSCFDQEATAGVLVARLSTKHRPGFVPVLVQEASVHGAKLTSAPQIVWPEGAWQPPFTAGMATNVKWIVAVPSFRRPAGGRERLKQRALVCWSIHSGCTVASLFGAAGLSVAT